MIRRIALAAAFLLVGSVPALAQTHRPPHAPKHRNHPPGHVRPDSAHHAAAHARLHGARLHGAWTGTLSAPHGVSSGLALSVAGDSASRLTLTMTADQPLRAGAVSDPVIDGNTLRWTQDLSGRPCKTTAVLSAATPLVPATMRGKMACDDGEITFTLRKTTG
jgi:hypothetical protein